MCRGLGKYCKDAMERSKKARLMSNQGRVVNVEKFQEVGAHVRFSCPKNSACNVTKQRLSIVSVLTCILRRRGHCVDIVNISKILHYRTNLCVHFKSSIKGARAISNFLAPLLILRNYCQFLIVFFVF